MNRIIFLIVFLLWTFPTWLLAETSVSGRVVFEGTPPAPETIKVKSERLTCGDVKEVHHLILGRDQGVANAVVTILGVKEKSAPAPKESVLDQVKCEYKPHVQVLSVGSTLKITSSDPILHNTHGFHEDGSTAFNAAIPITGMKVPVMINRPGVIKVRCDAGHTWMNAYIVGVDHPYYALTNENGNFKIDNVPPGTYEIEVWHEWLGKHRESITISESGVSRVITLKRSS